MKVELPELPPITDGEKQFLHYNPNTSDLCDFVRNYAMGYARLAVAQAVAAERAELAALREAVCMTEADLRRDSAIYQSSGHHSASDTALGAAEKLAALNPKD